MLLKKEEIMKIQSNSNHLTQNHFFIDTSNAERPFWDFYYGCKKDVIEKCPDNYSLLYYGKQGVGKTTLIKKLISEMNRQISDPLYVYCDLTVEQESKRVLESIRDTLANNYNFSFPLFDLALYFYERKIGKTISSQTIQALANKSNVLSSILSITGNLSLKDLTNQLKLCVNKVTALPRSLFTMHCDWFVRIETLPPNVLYEYIPYLFSIDLENNLADKTEPLVIFLDSYEKLVEKTSFLEESLNNDNWIHGANGLIQPVSTILWVIASREPIDFKDWFTNVSNKFQLKVLSQKQTTDFLKSIRITDSNLIDYFYQLSQGIPLYLNLCVCFYIYLLKKDEKFVFDNFQRNKYSLLEILTYDMNNSEKDILYILSLFEHWDDDMLRTIGEKIIPNFSLSSYNNIKSYKFVNKYENTYIIHQGIRDILMEINSESIAKKTVLEAINFYKSKWLDTDIEENIREHYFLMYLHMKSQTMKQRELIPFFENEIQEIYDSFIDSKKFELAKRTLISTFLHINANSEENGYFLFEMSKLKRKSEEFQIALDYAEKSKTIYSNLLNNKDLKFIKIIEHYGITLSDVGSYQKALAIFKYTLNVKKEMLGNEHQDTIISMNHLANTLDCIEDYEEALNLKKYIVSLYKKLFIDDHPNIINSLETVAFTLSLLKKYEEVLDVQVEILLNRKQSLGENHPDTLKAMDDFATTLSLLENYEDSLKIRKEVFLKSKEVFGIEHPKTVFYMCQLADSFRLLNNYDKFQLLTENALFKYRKLSKGKPLYITLTIEKLAENLSYLDKHKEIIPRRDLVSIKREILGSRHPDTIQASEKLANTYRLLKQYDEVFEIRKRLLSDYKESFGENHINTINAMSKFANSLDLLNRHSEALKIRKKVLSKCKKLFGENHINTLDAKSHLAFCLNHLEENQKALKIMKTVLLKCKELYGENSVHTINSIGFLAHILSKLGRNEEAVEIIEKALSTYNKLM